MCSGGIGILWTDMWISLVRFCGNNEELFYQLSSNPDNLADDFDVSCSKV